MKIYRTKTLRLCASAPLREVFGENLFLQMSRVENYYVYSAVVLAAFFGIIRGDGHGVGETGYLEAFLV